MRLYALFLAGAIIGLGVLTACNSAEWKNAKTSPTAPSQTTATAPPDGRERAASAGLSRALPDAAAAHALSERGEDGGRSVLSAFRSSPLWGRTEEGGRAVLRD